MQTATVDGDFSKLPPLAARRDAERIYLNLSEG
jgi:hypothetical protein